MKITILLILVVFATQFSNVGAAPPTLAAGTWWTLKGAYQWSDSGTGSHQGSYTGTGNYTEKFVVTSSDSNTVTIRINYNGAGSCSAQGTVFKDLSCKQTSWTWSSTEEFVIYTSTLLIQSLTINGKAGTAYVGHPVWVLTNPSKMTDGGTTPLLWCVPTSDAKDCTVTDVQASVSTQQLSLKGSMVKAWVTTYTGQTLGTYQNSAGVYSIGPETESYQYDPVYGIMLGASWNQKFDGTETGGVGSWTETYSENAQFVDSSLSFTVTATVSAEPSANVYVTVDGVKYASSQLPAKLIWVIGSTHTLAINSTIQGNGVRYVFVQWSDGSTDASRSLTVTQDTTLTATYKTQYQLTVVSDIGSPQGSGWYDANSDATFSVTASQTEPGFLGMLGGKIAFTGWSGDSTTTSPTGTIKMDGSKTVRANWTTDNSQPYLILGGIGAAIAAVLIFLILMKRRQLMPSREQEKETLPETTARAETRAPKAILKGPPKGMKFCLHCGIAIPAKAKFCTNLKCGKPQE